MKPRVVSTALVTLSCLAFGTHARGHEFLPKEQPAAKADRGGAVVQVGAYDELPEPKIEASSKPHPCIIPLPPVDQVKGAERLTMVEAESLAESFHPALREASGQIRAAKGNWLQVGLRPNPEIGYAGNEIGDEGEAGQQGAIFSQELVTAGKLGLNRAVALRGVAGAEQRLQIVRLQLLTTVRVQYFAVLAAEREVMLARQLTGIAAESVRVSKLRFEAMDIPRSALLQSQIESESTALLEQQASERYHAAWRRFATVVGINDPAPVVLEDAFAKPLPELHWESARDRVLAESPELAELRYAVDQARFQVQRASAGRVPNVTVQAGAQHDNATGSNIANVQVSMPVPIFDRNQGGVIQACGELTAAQAALRERELSLEQRLATAMRDYAVARKRVLRYAEQILPVARESLDIMNAGYQQGELEYLQLLMMQQTYAEKSLAYLGDLEMAWQKWAEIEGLMVGTLPDSN